MLNKVFATSGFAPICTEMNSELLLQLMSHSHQVIARPEQCISDILFVVQEGLVVCCFVRGGRSYNRTAQVALCNFFQANPLSMEPELLQCEKIYLWYCRFQYPTVIDCCISAVGWDFESCLAVSTVLVLATEWITERSLCPSRSWYFYCTIREHQGLAFLNAARNCVEDGLSDHLHLDVILEYE